MFCYPSVRKERFFYERQGDSRKLAKGKVVNTACAGDAMLGILAGYMNRRSLDETLRKA